MNKQQTLGFMFLMQNENNSIKFQNEYIMQQNNQLPRDIELMPLRELYTIEIFIDKKLQEMGDSAYNQLVSYKEQMILQLFRSKTPEEQTTVFEQLQIPDIIQE